MSSGGVALRELRGSAAPPHVARTASSSSESSGGARPSASAAAAAGAASAAGDVPRASTASSSSSSSSSQLVIAEGAAAATTLPQHLIEARDAVLGYIALAPPSAASPAGAASGDTHATGRTSNVKDKRKPPCARRASIACRSWCSFMRSALAHTCRGIVRKKCNYCLGFSACFMLVFVVCTIDYAFSQTPIIFLRFAEESNGEIDLGFYANSATPYGRVNYTAFAARVSDDTQLSSHSPRMIFTERITPAKRCRVPGSGGATPLAYNAEWAYLSHPSDTVHTCANNVLASTTNCVYRYCGEYIDARYLLVDFQRERQIGVGRSFSFSTLRKGEALIHQSLARRESIVVNDTVIVRIVINWMLGTESYAAVNSSISSEWSGFWNRWRVAYVPFRVAGIMASAEGKFDSDWDDVLMMDLPSFMEHAADYLHPNATAKWRASMSTSMLANVATDINLNFPPPRTDVYSNPSYDQVQRTFVQFASKTLYKLGFQQFDVNQDVLRSLSSLSFFALFMGLTSGMVIIVLSALCVVLVYSLLMIDVETRTFEFGVLRMIGMSRSHVVQLILTQAFMYAVPAYVFGLGFSQGLMVLVARFISSFGGINVSPLLPSTTIGVVTILTVVIPVASSLLPIRSALAQNLHDSLDTSRSKTAAIKVSIERGSDKRISVPLVVVGIFLAVYGFLIYYLMPLALISFNLSLLLQVFFILLIGLLLGLVLLSMNIQNLIERFVVTLFLFWERQFVFDLVQKNLVAHRLRNRKTTLMFSLSIAFIIFVLVTANVSVESFRAVLERRFGSPLIVSADTGDSAFFDDGAPYAVTNYAAFDTYLRNNPVVVDYGWMSNDMARTLKNADRDTIAYENIGRTTRMAGQRVLAVSPNFLELMYQKYLTIGESETREPYGLTQNIYQQAWWNGAIMGTTFQSDLQLKPGDSFLLYQADATKPRRTVHRDTMRPVTFIDAAPVVRLSRYPSTSAQDLLVSFPTFVRLSHGHVRSVMDIPMWTLMIKIRENVTTAELDSMASALSVITSPQTGVGVRDLRQRVSSFTIATSLLDYFFLFSTIMTMTVCFFSLSSSMFTNIMEQTKEIAVLRAVGLTSFPLIRIYIYESFVVIFASTMLGVVVGVSVGLTMSAQQSLFTQLPVIFTFPGVVFAVIVGCSVVMGFFAAFGPARSVARKSIIDALRIVV